MPNPALFLWKSGGFLRTSLWMGRILTIPLFMELVCQYRLNRQWECYPLISLVFQVRKITGIFFSVISSLLMCRNRYYFTTHSRSFAPLLFVWLDTWTALTGIAVYYTVYRPVQNSDRKYSESREIIRIDQYDPWFCRKFRGMIRSGNYLNAWEICLKIHYQPLILTKTARGSEFFFADL